MVAIVSTVAYLGLEARAVEVQVQLSTNVPAFIIVGLPDKAVAESRERVRAALSAIGLALPPKRITMWLQFKLNPTPPDPVQKQVFSIMPWVLMFVMAPFAAGLQLYWVVSNILGIAQQKYLYRKYDTERLATQTAVSG